MELRHREAGIVWAASLRGRHTARVDEFGGSLVAEARYSVALLPNGDKRVRVSRPLALVPLKEAGEKVK